QLAWSARPRRRSRANACAKSSSATAAGTRTSGGASHAEPMRETGACPLCASAGSAATSARSAAAAVPRPIIRPAGTRALLEDLRRAVTVLETDLVRPRGLEVDEEVAVDLHPALWEAVHPQQPRAQAGVELVVPGRVERVRHVQPPPVERELQHLRPSVQLPVGVALLPEAAT